ncbi:MAG: leucine-rich repeat domain-containing protein [Muribaculaceae bacterium]|nr:leucine-rich repeat domain-containing protein [Muribaculaceae bacterium]MDE6754452.1 leucine-rich repeat domain-containing protein [Muribaculaceae bacterium]
MKRLLLTLISWLTLFSVSAQEFRYSYEGETLPYVIIDEEAKTVKVGKSSESVSGSLIIPSSVVYDETAYTVVAIDDDALRNHNELISIEIPATVTSIGKYAFLGCDHLVKAEFASVAQMCRMEFANEYSNPMINAHTLYIDGREVKELVIPDSVTSIGSDAFNGCRGLISIEIPSSVTSIGRYAFKGCQSLIEITMPNSLSVVEDGIFYGCLGLSSIKLPDKLSSIGRDMFYGCKSLVSIDIPSSVTSIGNDAFYYCTGLTSVDIPSSVTSIGGSAFEGCRGLTSIILPETLTSVSAETFKACSGLISVVLPDSLVSIGRRAFEGCKQLGSVIMPDNVRYIGEKAFMSCEKLENITLPLNLEVIREGAFKNCQAIRNIKYRGLSPASLECAEDIFDENVYDEATLYVRSGTIPLFMAVAPWKLFLNISDTLSDSEITGINDAAEDNTIEIDSLTSVEIYNLNGTKLTCPVENIPSGFYIISKGNRLKKVFIK